MNNLHLVKNKDSQTSNQSPFLSIENVAKSYPTRNGSYTVLQNVNLSVEQGEFICVIGHSGCDKSTLLSMVSGFKSSHRRQSTSRRSTDY